MPSHPSESGQPVDISVEQSFLAEIFFFRRVLRAGWGVAFFPVLLFASVAAQTLFLVRFVQIRDEPHTVLLPRDALANFVMAMAVTVATWVLASSEQRHLPDYGFRKGRAWGHLFGGLLTGLAILSALVLLLHQLGLLVFRGQQIYGASEQWQLGLIWLGFYLLVVYAEESFARGYLQYTMTRGIAWLLRHFFAASSGVRLGFWVSAIVLSATIGWLHTLNSGETVLGLVNAGLFSLLMVCSLWRLGSLWWAFGFHLAWDWAQSFLWGVPDSGLRTRDHLFLAESAGSTLQSGGDTGPEGSLYTLGALVAAFGFLMLLHKRQVYPELWDEASRDSGETDNMLPDPGGAPVRQ